MNTLTNTTLDRAVINASVISNGTMSNTLINYPTINGGTISTNSCNTSYSMNIAPGCIITIDDYNITGSDLVTKLKLLDRLIQEYLPETQI